MRNGPAIGWAIDRVIQGMAARTDAWRVPMLLGDMVSAGGLLPCLDLPLGWDYPHISPYQGQACVACLACLKETDIGPINRVLLLIDDGLGQAALVKIIQYCKQAGAAVVYTAVLMKKKLTRYGIPACIYPIVMSLLMDHLDYRRNAAGLDAL